METQTPPTAPENQPVSRWFVGCGLLIFGVIVAAFSFFGGVAVGTSNLLAPLGLRVVDTDRADTPDDLQEEFAPFWETYDLLQELYVDQPIDDGALVEGAIQGMLESLDDPNTGYMSPTQFEISMQDFGGDLEGIGVEVDTSGEFLRVVSPMRGSPAEAAGVLPGDLIVAVDGVDLTGMDPFEAISLVRGPAGTDVTITVIREGEDEPLEFTITRYRITIAQAEGEMLDDRIGLVQINSFGDNTSAELEDTLKTLIGQGAEGFVIDLRNNPGGSLTAAVEAISQFIDESPVLLEEFGDGSQRTFSHIPGGLATDAPIVLLVNGGSASASEVFAMAVRDYDRGIILGETTFGKGTVQVWQPLTTNNGAVRITIAKWLSPEGTWVHEVGIEPDIVVELTPEDREAGLDPQLDAALENLREQLGVFASTP